MDRWIFDCFFTSFWDEAVGLFSGVSNISLTVDFRGVEVCIWGEGREHHNSISDWTTELCFPQDKQLNRFSIIINKSYVGIQLKPEEIHGHKVVTVIFQKFVGPFPDPYI